MYTKNDIISDIKKAGIKPTDTVLMHSSIKSVGELENGADTILDAFCEYLSEGLFVLPTHTWRDIDAQNPHFDVLKSEVCVGMLPEVFRKRKGVYRSLHPTHSLAAYGISAEEFVKGEENCNTPCNPKSCYGKLEKMGAKVILLGVNFGRCTIIHCIEEVARVQGKLTQEYESLFSRNEIGLEFLVKSFRHNNSNSELFVKLEPVLRHRNQIEYRKLGDSDMRILEAKTLFATTLELLDRDIFLFNDDKPVPIEWY